MRYCLDFQCVLSLLYIACHVCDLCQFAVQSLIYMYVISSCCFAATCMFTNVQVCVVHELCSNQFSVLLFCILSCHDELS